jgi:hypothetical protein
MSEDELDSLLAKLAAPARQRPLHLVGTKRFELRRPLGSGGFGEVYEARDREHGTRVALKALKSANPDWIYRFKREFRLVGDLAHPNLVRLFELFVEKDRWYLTMELIDGLRFDTYLTRAPDRLRASFQQLALGVAELHRARCLHRDLKPSNALVESTGRVVLLDFGLAVHQRATRTSAVAGTPLYMAPELGLGQPPTEASDWYALGVMLYDALAGAPPFTGGEIAMMQQKLDGAPRRPSVMKSEVDPELEALAMRLIDRDPRARATGSEVLDVLLGDGASSARRHVTASSSIVVGRDPELELLEAAMHASRTAAAVVRVTGIPGIGKSALVGAFLDRLRTSAHAYQGRCLELESVPFKGLDGAVDSLCNALSRLRYDDARRIAPHDVTALAQMFPMLKRVEAFSRARLVDAQPRTPQQIRDAASKALRELIANIAADAPVVLFIDDLQWASDDTAQLLLELVTPPAPRVLLVVAYRAGDQLEAPVVGHLVAGLQERGVPSTEIEVVALDHHAVERWIAQQGASEATALTTEQALRETAGHPHLLARLLELGGSGEDRPIELAAILAAELAQLDGVARRLLEVVSVAGGPIRLQAAFEAAGVPRDPATLDHLRRRRLVRSGAGEAYLEAYHDRVREIVLQALPAERRSELHLALAHALERSDVAEAAALARHYREGGDRTNALAWTLRAADHATAALAFARAVELYRDAVPLASSDTERIQVLGQLVDAQVQRGLRSDAAHTSLEAARLARELGRDDEHAAFRARAGEHFLLAGQLERGFDLVRDALVDVGVTLPQSAAVAVAESFNVGGALAARGLEPRRRSAVDDARLVQRVDLELAVARSLTQIDLRGPLMAARGLADALELGELGRVQRALSLFVLNHAARMPGDSLMVAAEAQAIALADELADEASLAWAEIAAGMHAIYRHELTQALHALSEAERRFVALPGFAREAALARLGIVLVCGNYGVDLSHGTRRHAGFVDEMLSRGDVFSATWGRFVQILNELAAGNPTKARGLIDAVTQTWPNARDSLMSASLLLHRVAIRLFEEPGAAWDLLEEVRPEYGQMYSSMIPVTIQLHARIATNAATSAFVAGRAERDTTLARVGAALDTVAAHPDLAITWLIRGHHRLLEGDPAGALDCWKQTAAIWKAAHQPMLEHAVRLRIGELGGDAGMARKAAVELSRLGVGDPARFSVVIAGALAPMSRRT